MPSKSDRPREIPPEVKAKVDAKVDAFIAEEIRRLGSPEVAESFLAITREYLPRLDRLEAKLRKVAAFDFLCRKGCDPDELTMLVFGAAGKFGIVYPRWGDAVNANYDRSKFKDLIKRMIDLAMETRQLLRPKGELMLSPVLLSDYKHTPEILIRLTIPLIRVCMALDGHKTKGMAARKGRTQPAEKRKRAQDRNYRTPGQPRGRSEVNTERDEDYAERFDTTWVCLLADYVHKTTKGTTKGTTKRHWYDKIADILSVYDGVETLSGDAIRKRYKEWTATQDRTQARP